MSGNPNIQLANHPLPAVPKKQIRAIRDDWYVRNDEVAVIGEVYTVPADEAAGAIALQRAELVT